MLHLYSLPCPTLFRCERTSSPRRRVTGSCHVRGRVALLKVLLLLLAGGTTALRAQSLDIAPGDFISHTIVPESRPMPLTHVREDDVVWEHLVWRTINFQEKFNQFFYYPVDRKGVHGHKNFAYVLWEALERGELPIYADDELLIPLDGDAFLERYTRPDTLVIEIQDDEDEYLVEYRSVIVPKEFTAEDVLQLRLKEAWYLDKQTTGQYVRILALALTQDMFKDIDGEREFMGTVTLFWVPMQSQRVRSLLVRKQVYYNPNLSQLPTWERIFLERYFDSYITRESNRFNRPISTYLTGTDAIQESERIEDYLLEISEDQWEW